MNRHATQLARWAVLFSTLGFAAAVAQADTKGVRIRAASEAVQQALRCEARGADYRRQELIQSALEQVPDYPPALWQSGHVRHQNQWVRFDELPDLLAEDSRMAEYRHRREEAPQTLEGQLALAQWCAKRKLDEQARAHLTAVLEIDPEHSQARHLLGYRRVDGTWLSTEEVQQAAVRAAQAESALKTWKPEIERILQGLTHRSQRQREVATERLLSIADPGAIHAMELVLSTHSEETALLVVQVLDKTEASEAAVALARQGVFSQWDRVREEAVKSLRRRDPAEYVPVLLSALSTPVQGRAELYRAPSGRLRYRHTFYREGQEQAQLAVLETEYPLTVLSAGSVASYGVRAALLDDARRQDAAMKAQAREAAVAQQNEAIRQSNERICCVLSKATGEPLLAMPERWWQWWNEYNEVYVPSEKPVRWAYRQDTVRFDDPGPAPPEDEQDNEEESRPFKEGTLVYSNPSGFEVWETDPRRGWIKDSSGNWLPYLSCLVAGTLVWTDAGLVPIEEVEVGDGVLSQDPQSGELAYKPVLKTTVRPPARMLKIVFGDKALQCSGGHPFWIAGKGWVFARDLEEGAHLHAVEGTAEVRSVHPTGFEQLHNLVVADFHTYFVTDAKILTHDNTIREPTDALVPGLVDQNREQMNDRTRPRGLLAGTEPRETR